MGNHRDAWVYGGGDPSSGTACMMEVARVISEMSTSHNGKGSSKKFSNRFTLAIIVEKHTLLNFFCTCGKITRFSRSRGKFSCTGNFNGKKHSELLTTISVSQKSFRNF